MAQISQIRGEGKGILAIPFLPWLNLLRYLTAGVLIGIQRN
jgi:hypothetical protein